VSISTVKVLFGTFFISFSAQVAQIFIPTISACLQVEINIIILLQVKTCGKERFL
jgi:hypothetical protein